jgi:ABC-type transport system involved in cytochrome c biogenesis permease subunit
MLPNNFWLIQSAFTLQLVAVALFIGYAFAARRAFSSAATAALGLSGLLLLLFVYFTGLHAVRIPLASGFEALVFWSLLLTALVLWVEIRHQLGLLGAFLAPLSALTLLMSFRFAQADALAVPGLSNAWLMGHVALAMLSYACLTVSAGIAAAFLLQDSQLRHKKLGSYQLPPLQTLEALMVRFVALGVGALAASLAAGFTWRWQLYQGLGLEDPKVGFSLGVISAYASAMLLRSRGALGGRRLAWLLLGIFAGLFFGYYLVNLYFGGHGFLKAGA